MNSALFAQAPVIGGGGIEEEDPELAEAIRMSLMDSQPQVQNNQPQQAEKSK